jgi:hypothetical protein
MSKVLTEKNTVKPVIKNSFGRDIHPTDELIHWQDRDFIERGWGAPVGEFKTFDEYVDALRAAYDLLLAGDPNIKAAYDLLSGAIRHKAAMEEGEREAGEDL